MSIRQKQLNPPLPNSKNKSTDFKGTVHFKTPCAVFLFWGTVQGEQSIGRLPALKNPHTKIKKVGFPLPYFFTQGAKLRHLYNTARKQTHETIHNEQSIKMFILPQNCAPSVLVRSGGCVRTTTPAPDLQHARACLYNSFLATPAQSPEAIRKIALQAFLCVVAVASGRQRLRRIVGAAEPLRNERSECRNGAEAEPRKAGLLDAFAP